ncbi:MAG: RNA polymerase sigma factor [Anaerolineae bacterium]|nr:RNA polymerase sigma factor [Anaerolineae bacterium]
MAESADAALVSQAQSGDVAAFEALYKKYSTMVFRTAYAILRDRYAAEEVTQECFIRAYRGLARVQACDSLGPWLHRIAVNLSYNWWRQTHRYRLLPLDSLKVSEHSARTESPQAALHRAEVNDALAQALDTLGFDQKVALILFYLGGFSLEEIAYILDCPVGTVKSRLHYGRSKLRRTLEQMQRTLPEVAYEF